MDNEVSLLTLVLIEFVLFISIIIYYENQKRVKVARLQFLVKNALSKGYLDDSSIERYAALLELRYQDVQKALQKLIVDLETENEFSDSNKLAQLKNFSRLYEQTGFLTNIPDVIRTKMKDLASLNPKTSNLIYQLAQEIQTLHSKEQRWKRIGIIISIASTTITLWKISPDVIHMIRYISLS